MNRVTHEIDAAHLNFEKIQSLLSSGAILKLSESARQRIEDCRRYLDRRMTETDDVIYGINTGFGSLCNTRIGRQDLEQLQANLVMSHACGAGREMDRAVVKLMLLLKIQGLSYGHSGVTVDTVERLIAFYNQDVLPVVYEYGSLGASGDLAPLAHLSLPLFGMGEVWYNGTRMPAEQALQTLGLSKLRLRSKEGLALLNGTQFMSAIGITALKRSLDLLNWADLIAAMSLEAFDGRPEPFNEAVHLVRRQPGQLLVARNIKSVLKESALFGAAKQHVQDPYSFRCIPQVHGASRDVWQQVLNILENEVNSVTDNPTIFPEEDLIISAGNFHGQPLAVQLDFLAIAMAEIGSISERRIYKLVSGSRGLPPFLIAEPGLNSGFMIPQYAAASMVSRNKQLCTPSSVDTIDSSNGQEDHVSMGANAGVKLLDVLDNVQRVLAIELMNAAQALELRGLDKTSPVIGGLHNRFRQVVPFLEKDRPMYIDMEQARKFLRDTDPQTFLK